KARDSSTQVQQVQSRAGAGAASAPATGSAGELPGSRRACPGTAQRVTPCLFTPSLARPPCPPAMMLRKPSHPGEAHAGNRRPGARVHPAGFTPGCTREACQIRDLHAELDASGLRVAGVSPQSPESHRAFREKYKLPFTLLADVDRFVIKMYDVRGPLGFGVRRATFLIDQSRHIQDTVIADFRI